MYLTIAMPCCLIELIDMWVFGF